MSNKTHKMSLKKKYFDMISCGEKTIELRLFDTKRKAIAPGDSIIFVNGEEEIQKKVIGLVVSENFKTLFSIVPCQKAGFTTEESALNVMEEFYPTKTQNEVGVVGVVLK